MQRNLLFLLSFLGLVFSCNYLVALVFSGNSSSASMSNKIQNMVSPDGFLDQSFGKLGTNFIAQSISGGAQNDTAHGLALQSNGKIVLAGISANDIGANFAVAQFMANGQLDTSFGAGNPNSLVPGTVFIPASISGGGYEGGDEANAVVVQADGKIVVGGFTYSDGGTVQNFALARFLPNGFLDESFGKNNPNSAIPGTVFIPAPLAGGSTGGYLSDQIFALAIQADGAIIAAGSSLNATTGITHFTVARFTTEGLLDETFGQGADYSLIPGTIALPAPLAGGGGYGATDQVNGVAIQSDGKIVMGGYSQYPTGNYSYFALARVTSEGILDESFGQGNPDSVIPGTVFINGSLTNLTIAADQAQAVALQTDGRILLGGWSVNPESGSNFAVARFLTTGFLDESFGKNSSNSFISGTVYVPACIAGHTEDSEDKAFGLVLQLDGKCVLAGYSTDVSNNGVIALARFTTDGNPDLTFGLGNPYSLEPGTVFFPGTIAGPVTYLRAVGMQADGKIVGAGVSGIGMGGLFAIACFFNPSSFVSYKTEYTQVGAGLNA